MLAPSAINWRHFAIRMRASISIISARVLLPRISAGLEVLRARTLDFAFVKTPAMSVR